MSNLQQYINHRKLLNSEFAENFDESLMLSIRILNEQNCRQQIVS